MTRPCWECAGDNCEVRDSPDTEDGLFRLIEASRCMVDRLPESQRTMRLHELLRQAAVELSE